MSEDIKRSALEDLIEFLLLRPEAAKYLPSVFEAYKENKIRLKQFEIDDDPFLIRIIEVLSNELVVREKRFEELLNFSKEEIRSRINHLVGKYPDSFSIDRLHKEDWVIFITKEGLINV